MFTQLTEAYSNDRRVVLIALKTDGGGAAGAKAYFRGKADTSSWIIGSDSNEVYYEKVIGEKGKLYRYAIMKPDGTVAQTGHAGMYRQAAGKKQFSLAADNIGAKYGADASVLLKGDTVYKAEFSKTVFLAEIGLYKEAIVSVLQLARKPGMKDDALKIRADILSALDKKVDELEGDLASGDIQKRYPSYMHLRTIAIDLGREECGKKAKAALKKISGESWVKEEQNAEKAYLSLKRKGEKLTPEQREKLLIPAFRKLAEKYKNTYYGVKAAAE